MAVKMTAKRSRVVNSFRFNLALAFLAGLFVFWLYTRTPSETEAAVVLGFSPLRLALLSFIALLLLAMLLMLISSRRNAWWNNGFGRLVALILERDGLFWVALALIGGIYVFLFLSEHQLGPMASYRRMLYPILAWIGFTAFQFIIGLVYSRLPDASFLENYRGALFPAGFALVFLALLISFISLTRVGLQPDAVYWQEPGVPILFPQVLVAWIAGLLFYFLVSRTAISQTKTIDLLVPPGLWILASALWLNQPLAPAYNSFEPRPPNYQPYPFGDALLYDVTAHGFLAGKPIPSDFWVKPLYSLLLSFLHLLAGEDISLVISLQVLVLATIPVLIYLLTADLGGRPAGLVAAILTILRERNGIALSNVIEVSHSKLLMSDVFSMGLMVLLVWLLVRWLRQADGFHAAPLIIGGVIAMLTLTRGHPILLLPLVLLISFFMLPPLLRWKSLFLLVSGFAIPLIPWLHRNYEFTGKLTFQDPISPYNAQIAGLYSMTPSVVASPGISGETDSEYYERLQRQTFRFVIEHPDEVVKFITAHYLHNTINSYIILPHSFAIDSLRAHIKTEHFWQDWQGGFTLQGWTLFFLNICVLALGLGGAWKNAKVLSLIPLLIGIGYNLSVSVGRLSGWRFILPADWITLVYYSIGLMQFACLMRYSLRRELPASENDDRASQAGSQRSPRASLIGFGALFLVISLLLTYGHGLFSQRVPSKTPEQLAQILKANAGWNSSFDIEKFLEADQAVILGGKALYPSFFEAGTGALNYYWLSFQSRPYDRLIFYLLSDQSTGVILPMPGAPPVFPDGADVIVIGCTSNEEGVLDAWAVLVQGNSTILYTRQPQSDLTCPPPEPQ
jgi:hypothetical protein